jgi:phage terminase large subunit GpA-like protein
MINDIHRTALAHLAPPPKLDLPEWIEANIRLPSTITATPGRMKLTAVQRGIAIAIGDPLTERVTLQKCVRIGLSTLLHSTILSFVVNDPTSILILLPTEADARNFVVHGLDPMADASPAARGLMTLDVDHTGRSTMMQRIFPGGSWKAVAAKSPRNLRAHNARVLLMDEVDAYETSAEGSPVALAEKRTLSFPNRKIVLGSTPTHESTSNVAAAYANSDQRVFEICCPGCSTWFELLWRHIHWDEGRPETAHAVCESCGTVIEEREKPDLVEHGRWRATKPEVVGHAGFRVNALVSNLPNASWSILAKEFLAAKRNPETLKVFVNTILAETWRDSEEELDERELASRAEPLGLDSIPPECLILTCGVDVQIDRLELVLLGHGKDHETFVLANHVVWGRVDNDETWQELDDYLKQSWPHPNGGTLRIDATAIDSGDGNTMDVVRRYCAPRFNRRIVAVKGASGNRPSIEKTKSDKGLLFVIGVDGEKQRLVNRLSHGRSVRFSKSLEARFFEELTSERMVIRYTRGQPVRLWERKAGARAECLDAFVYGMAVRNLVGLDLGRRAEELSSPRHPGAARPAVIRSKWLSR